MHLVVQATPLGIRKDNLDIIFHAFQEPAHTRECASSTRPTDERLQLSVGLPPNLRTSPIKMSLKVAAVLKLVGEEAPGPLDEVRVIAWRGITVVRRSADNERGGRAGQHVWTVSGHFSMGTAKVHGTLSGDVHELAFVDYRGRSDAFDGCAKGEERVDFVLGYVVLHDDGWLTSDGVECMEDVGVLAS